MKQQHRNNEIQTEIQWVNSSDLLGRVKTSYILTTGKITH